jgi:hypothetical protein
MVRFEVPGNKVILGLLILSNASRVVAIARYIQFEIKHALPPILGGKPFGLLPESNHSKTL